MWQFSHLATNGKWALETTRLYTLLRDQKPKVNISFAGCNILTKKLMRGSTKLARLQRVLRQMPAFVMLELIQDQPKFSNFNRHAGRHPSIRQRHQNKPPIFLPQTVEASYFLAKTRKGVKSHVEAVHTSELKINQGL
jgi:hypothetical protein